ncbi:MAG: hypothetical protein V5A59_11435 [Bacteroidales bacterium]|nr:hypothetical protein [Bacteroidales bacterium]
MKNLKSYRVKQLKHHELKIINGGDKFLGDLGRAIGRFVGSIFDGEYCDAYGARVYKD